MLGDGPRVSALPSDLLGLLAPQQAALPREAGLAPTSAVVPQVLSVEPRPTALAIPGPPAGDAPLGPVTTWLLSAAARRVLGVAIALGVIWAIAWGAIIGVAISQADTTAGDRTAVTTSLRSSDSTFSSFGTAVGHCSTLSCARAAAAVGLKEQLNTVSSFEQDYVGVSVADVEHRNYLASLVRLVADYTAAGKATSELSFEKVLITGLVPDIQRLETDAKTLYVALGGTVSSG